MKTAILMATFNGERFLEMQLNSIKTQTVKPDYVVFRDDCSTDGTVEYIEKYISENRLKNWIIKKNEKNIGWRLTFRQLMKDSQSLGVDYVFFCDQDDFWYENKVQQQVKGIGVHPEAELLSCNFSVKNTNGTTYKVSTHEFNKTEMISKYPKRMSFFAFKLGFTYMVSSKFIDDILVVWSKDYDRVAHDRLMALSSNMVGTGYNLNETLADHIFHGENASGNDIITIHSSKKKHLDELKEGMQYYKVVSKFLDLRNKKEDAKFVKDYYSFYARRYEAGKTDKVFSGLYQVFKDWSKYPVMGSRVRDIIFSFKRIN